SAKLPRQLLLAKRRPRWRWRKKRVRGARNRLPHAFSASGRFPPCLASQSNLRAAFILQSLDSLPFFAAFFAGEELIAWVVDHPAGRAAEARKRWRCLLRFRRACRRAGSACSATAERRL